MNSEICIGKLYYKKMPFQLFFQVDTKKVVARLEGEHFEKKRWEKIVTDLIQIKDGGGYSIKKLSIKKLAIFAGMLACLGKPTMLVHASEPVRIEDSLEKEETDTLEFNKDLIDQEIVLYGKEEVDKLFVNESISKEGVLRILNRSTSMNEEVKGYIRDFVETVYEKEPNADMRIFAMNLLRNPQIYVNLDAKMSFCSPGENRVWFHKRKRELIFHELSHLRTLTYGESYVKNDPKARIKVVGNSFVNSYAGSGMREAYCVTLNHRIGMDDTDYDVLYTMEKALSAIFPDKMTEIETYNDYEGLKEIFLTHGLTARDYDSFIATTDTISKIYQSDDLSLDSSLISSMMKPVVTLAKNKCIMEGLNYNEYISKIESSLPDNEWKSEIMTLFQGTPFLNFTPTVNEEGERIVLESTEVGPAFDDSLKSESNVSEVGPAFDENLKDTNETSLFLGEENVGPAFDLTLQEPITVEDKLDPVEREDVNLSTEQITPSFAGSSDWSLKENISYEAEVANPVSENVNPFMDPIGPAFDENLKQNTSTLPNENIGPAFDENLQTNIENKEIGPGVDMDSYGLFFEEPMNFDSQSNRENYEEFNQISPEYYEETNLRR